MIRHVAIVGAGFSGTLQAINLLQQDGPRVTLIERGESFGRGIAYSTDLPGHVLNVRAANMSAFPDRPDHFVAWRAERGHGDPQAFASRAEYGDYLGDLLRAAIAHAPGRLDLCRDTVADIAVRRGGVRLMLDSGRQVQADAAVLALGNLPPHDPPGLATAGLDADVYAPDPWAADFCTGLRDEDIVLLVGTGLTMVDAVLMLEARGFGGRIVALSRRGLAPHSHAGRALAATPVPPLDGHGSDLIHAVRRRAREIGWREVVDGLRPHIQGLWRTATLEQQRRFLRHLRPWWDIHRHRLAPEVADRIASLRASGRLRVVGGSLLDVTQADRGATMTWRPRGSSGQRTERVRRIVNCTGPQGDLLRTRQPLLRLLLASGHIRPDRHRMGIDIDETARTIAVDGRINHRLLAIGPLTRGAFWEIVAVPDIRVQAAAVAASLLGPAGHRTAER